jgi:hypothetical protein
VAVAATLFDGVMRLVSGFSLENIKLHLAEHSRAARLDNRSNHIFSLLDDIVW